MLKIVLDTNALLDGSTDDYNFCNRIINEVIAGNLEAYANRQTLSENKLLAGKKILDPGYSKRLEYFFTKIKLVPTRKLNQVLDDPEDNKILASAIAARADYLITSDKHLLSLEVRNLNIATPAQFWSVYMENSEGGWVEWLGKFIS